jgi:hypothetical protein
MLALNVLRRGRSSGAISQGKAASLSSFTNLAALTAAGLTAAAYNGRLVYLTAGGTGSVSCLAISDGTNWKQIAIGVNAI